MPIDGRRPVHLNLMKIRLPVAGWLSIIHRGTGILLFIATPFLIYLLQLSLSGPDNFQRANALLHAPVAIILVVLLLWSITHHLLAGVRYLLLDMDVGVDHPMFVYSARIVMIVSPLVALLLVMVVL